jgi:energy-converting hydrogenase Eha subunit E
MVKASGMNIALTAVGQSSIVLFYKHLLCTLTS